MNQRLSTRSVVLLLCSVSVKDSLDSQLEDTKLFTVKRTYVTLNWVDRKTAFTVSQDKESLAPYKHQLNQPLNLPAVPGSHVLLQN